MLRLLMGRPYPLRVLGIIVTASAGVLSGCNLVYSVDDLAGDRPDATSDVRPLPPPIDAPVEVGDSDAPSPALPPCTANCALSACASGYCVSSLVARERYLPTSTGFAVHPLGAYWTYGETLYEWRMGGEMLSVTTSTEAPAKLVVNARALFALRDSNDTTVLQELAGGALVERLQVVEDKPRVVAFPWKDGIAWLSRTVRTGQHHVRTWRPGEKEAGIAWVAELSHLVGGDGFATFLRKSGGVDYVGVVNESWVRLWERPFSQFLGLSVAGRNVLVATEAGIDRVDFETGTLPARTVTFSSGSVNRGNSFVATGPYVYWAECPAHGDSGARNCSIVRGTIGEQSAQASTYVSLQHEGSIPELLGYDNEALWLALGTNLYRIHRIE